MSFDINELPVSAKSEPIDKPLEVQEQSHIALHPFPCTITSVRAKAKKVEVTLILDDFPIVNKDLNPVFGNVNDKGGIEDSAFATFGRLHKEGRILVLEGATVDIQGE